MLDRDDARMSLVTSVGRGAKALVRSGAGRNDGGSMMLGSVVGGLTELAETRAG